MSIENIVNIAENFHSSTKVDLNDKIVIEALWQNSGMLAASAKFLQISYIELKDYIEADKSLVELLNKIQNVKSELLTEALEDKVFAEAMAGDNNLLWKLLNVYSKGKFSTKSDTENNVSEKLNFMLAKFKEMTIENVSTGICSSSVESD
ncbi:MAG: hypothetical protein Q8P20_01205 [bacterium]|nr:hypothetical protein [bacterium]